MKSKSIVLLTAVVSIFGLTSCSADKGPRDDAWALPHPLLVPPGVSPDHKTSVSFTTSVLEPVSVGSKIVFRDDGEKNMAGVTLRITSDCRSGNESASLETTLANTSAIELRSLIPKEYWLRVDLPKDESLLCNFRFEGRNVNGSTHRFEVASVRFANWSDLESAPSITTDVDSTRMAQFVSIPQLIQNERLSGFFVTDTVTNADTEWELELVCERFRNSRKVTARRFNDGLLAELAEGPIHSALRAVMTQDDTRQIYSRQNCRLIAATLDKTSNVYDFKMTPRFAMQFSGPKIEVEFATGFNAIQVVEYKDQSVFKMTIHNRSQHVVALVTPRRGAQRVWLQAVIMRASSINYQETYPEEFDLLISGARHVANNGETEVFELAPGDALHLEQKLSKERSQVYCSNWTVSTSEALRTSSSPDLAQRKYWVGMRVGFDRDFVVERLLNWDPQTRDVSGPKRVIANLPWTKLSNEGLLPGWLPHDAWVEFSGSRNPPASILPAAVNYRDCGKQSELVPHHILHRR